MTKTHAQPRDGASRASGGTLVCMATSRTCATTIDHGRANESPCETISACALATASKGNQATGLSGIPTTSAMTIGAESCSKWPGVTMWFIHSAISGNLSARNTPRTTSNQCSVVAGGGTASEGGTAGAGPAAGVAIEPRHSSSAKSNAKTTCEHDGITRRRASVTGVRGGRTVGSQASGPHLQAHSTDVQPELRPRARRVAQRCLGDLRQARAQGAETRRRRRCDMHLRLRLRLRLRLASIGSSSHRRDDCRRSRRGDRLHRRWRARSDGRWPALLLLLVSFGEARLGARRLGVRALPRGGSLQAFRRFRRGAT